MIPSTLNNNIDWSLCFNGVVVLRYLFISGHDKSITGGNKRFERLASYAIENKKSSFWVSIERNDLPIKVDRLIYLSKPFLPTYSLRLLYACVRDRKKIKALSAFDKLVVFGETPLLAALFLAWYLKVDFSVGVRSNVPKRHMLELQATAGLGLIKARLRYILNDLVIKCAFRRSANIIVQSPGAKSDLCNNYPVPPEKVFVLPNDLPSISLDLERKASRRQVKDKPLSILFVGNASRIKGFDNLIELISMLNVSGYEFHFTIVGVSKLSLPVFKNVKVIPRSNNVYQLMLNNDLLVVPSREDQFPNVVLEALSVGLPVIGADVDGIAYIINDKRFLFEPGSTRSFYEVFMFLQKGNNYLELVAHVKDRRGLFVFDWEKQYLSLC